MSTPESARPVVRACLLALAMACKAAPAEEALPELPSWDEEPEAADETASESNEAEQDPMRSTVIPAGKQEGSPQFGTPATEADIAGWDLTVYPDGTGLPDGSGTPIQGKPLFARKCAACHGTEGLGGTADELAGGRHPLDSEHPDKNVGAYWPYATTLFDFTRRAMPMDAPGSLSANETYAITAYILHLNGIIGESDEMNSETLPAVRMPNRDGFLWIDAVPPSAQ